MIHILWSTVRPQQFSNAYNMWKVFAHDPSQLKLKVAVDNGGDKNYLQDEKVKDITIVDNPKHGVVLPIYRLCEQLNDLADDDLIILASDDFTPPRGWDIYLYDQFENFDGVFKVNDGPMKPIVTLPVLTYKAFKQLNRVIYHPAYNHMFSDQEMHDVVHELGICKHASASDPLFTHRHYVNGMREKDQFDERLMDKFKESRILYQERRKLSIEERLKV